MSDVNLSGALITVDAGVQQTPQDLFSNPPVIPPGSFAGSVAPAQIAASPTSSGVSPTWGKTVPYMFGAAQITGELLWTGKSSTVTDDLNNTYVKSSFAVVFGRVGPRASHVDLMRIYFDGNPVYNTTNDGLAVFPATFNFTLYDGTQTAPDPTILADEGVAPAFLGMVYIVVTNYQVLATNNNMNFPVVQAEFNVQTQPYVGGGRVFPFQYSAPLSYANEMVWDYASRTLAVRILNSSTFDFYDTDGQDYLRTVQCFPTYGDTGYHHQLSSIDQNIWLICGAPGANRGSVSLCDAYSGAEVGQLVSGDSPLTQYALPGLPGDADEYLIVGQIFNDMMIVNRNGNALSLRRGSIPTPGNFNTPPTNFFNQTDWTNTGFDGSQFALVYYSCGNKVMRTIITPGGASTLVGSGPVKSGSGYTLNRQMRAERDDILLTVADGSIAAVIVGKSGKYVYVLVNRTDGHAVARRYETYYNRHWPSQTRDSTLMTAAQVDAAGDFEFFALVSEVDLGARVFNARQSAQNIKPNTQTIVMIEAGGATGAAYEIDLARGVFKAYNPGDWYQLPSVGGYDYGYVNWPDGMIYDYDNRSCFYANGITDRAGRVYFAGNASSNRPAYLVSDALRDLALLAGYDTSKIITSNCDDAINGMILNTSVQFKDLAAQICAVFRIDMTEPPDFTIKFNRPDRTSLYTLNPTDLIPATSGGDQHLVTTKRVAANMLPNILQLMYIDPDFKYDVGMQLQKRVVYPAVTVSGKTVLVMSIPIVMTHDVAAYWAGYAIYDMWAGATSHIVTVPYKFLFAEPGDFCTLVMLDGRSALCKVSALTINADMSTTLTLDVVVSQKPVPRRQIGLHKTAPPYIES